MYVITATNVSSNAAVLAEPPCLATAHREEFTGDTDAIADTDIAICVLELDHTGPHYDPFDRVLWEVAP